MNQSESRTLKRRADELRRIAAKSKTRVGRHIATVMAREKDLQAERARVLENARAATRH